jgi:energy-coupling factor transporter ATP-binding protein EcfA2
MSAMALIGTLFPSGGRVEPQYMVDREGDVAELVFRVREGVHTLLDGPRRIGKSTVCNASAGQLREQDGSVVIWLEAPKQTTGTGFCQLLIDQCTRIDVSHLARQAGRAMRPTIEALLKTVGVPLDLSSLGGHDVPPATRRGALELPLRIARQHDAQVVFCIDELQRTVEYSDGEGLVGDLVDIYAGQTNVVLLVSGSQDRVVQKLLAEPFNVGKLLERRTLSATIPRDQWRRPLAARFEAAELTISGDQLEEVLDFGQERPYDTMTAARYVALTARKLEVGDIDGQCIEEGLREARQHLEDDDD